jgi:hypothetical protein
MEADVALTSLEMIVDLNHHIWVSDSEEFFHYFINNDGFNDDEKIV